MTATATSPRACRSSRRSSPNPDAARRTGRPRTRASNATARSACSTGSGRDRPGSSRALGAASGSSVVGRSVPSTAAPPRCLEPVDRGSCARRGRTSQGGQRVAVASLVRPSPATAAHPRPRRRSPDHRSERSDAWRTNRRCVGSAARQTALRWGCWSRAETTSRQAQPAAQGDPDDGPDRPAWAGPVWRYGTQLRPAVPERSREPQAVRRRHDVRQRQLPRLAHRRQRRIGHLPAGLATRARRRGFRSGCVQVRRL